MTDATDMIGREAAIEAVQRIVYEPMNWNVGAYSTVDAHFHNPFHAVIDVIRALPSVGVTVKPLEWVNDNYHSRIRAKTTIGDYLVWWGYKGEEASLRFNEDPLTKHDTIEAAKAAAQADYEARILSALNVQPAPDAAQVRARVAAAIFDPGATEGYKGERSLTQWQVDAVMRALITTPAPSPDVAAAILDAQLRCMEQGRIDTPEEIRARAALARKGGA